MILEFGGLLRFLISWLRDKLDPEEVGNVIWHHHYSLLYHVSLIIFY